MWDSFRLSVVGSFSLRKIALLFVAAVMSASFLTAVNGPTTFAAPATWNGDTLTYNGHPYTNDGTTLSGVPQGWDAYIYKPTDQPGTAYAIAVNPAADKSADIADAQLIQYNYDGSTYTNPRPPNNESGTITISAQSGDAAEGDENPNKTSCDVPGVGWIVCSTSKFIAGAMDRVYGWINGFLTVKPLTTDTSSGLYQAWNITRGLANACFIIAFLIIIYSQITSYGISNYEIKKMIPKLIIAAILVNVSYFVCAIAVDISNILGDSVQAALVEIRNSLPAPLPDGDWWRSWESLAEFILSGGTIGTAGALLAMTGGATGGAISAMAALLVPVLVAGILSVLVALIILAARQALITVLIVISPLAFVAYLLPNTEKYFEKWRGLFMTMLLVFPMFSLLFGGSQLASYIIIQNTNQISVVILALFVQVAPLALTPFLVRFSGSLLGKLAGMVNNPQKGLVDRTRNWAKDRADTMAKRRMALSENKGFGLGRMAYKRELNRRKWSDTKKRYDTALGAAYMQTTRGQYINSRIKDSELKQSAGNSQADLMHEQRRASDTPAGRNLTQYAGQQRENQEAVKTYQTREEATWNEMKSRNMTSDNRFAARAQAVRHDHEEHRVAEGRLRAAQDMQKIEFANDMIKSEALQNRMGGIADHGGQRALAVAVSEYRKDYNDRIGEANAILKHYNLSGQQRQDHALGKTVWVEDENKNLKALRADSIFTREAAIDYQIRTSNYKDIEEIVRLSGSDLQKYKTTISQAMAEAGASKRAVFLGGRTIDRVAQGEIPNHEVYMQVVLESVAKGKISAQDLATNEDTGLQRILEAVRDRQDYAHALSESDRNNLDSSIAQLFETADKVLTDPQLGRDLKKNARDVLEDLMRLRPGGGGTQPTSGGGE